jgi:hypothetical protein
MIKSSSNTTRIAVVSSPRSGNSWIRSAIAGALGWEELAVHNYLDVPLAIPNRCFLQIHWYREPNFQNWLKANHFSVLTVARHPLDILLSALHYVNFEPETARWLEGNAELPGSLIGTTPRSKEFLEYSLSMGAENLLSITYQWWTDKDVMRVRYEDAVASPKTVLGGAVAKFGGDAGSIEPWLERLSISNMQATHNRHGWRGQPGLWRRLITPRDAHKIYRRHQLIFDTLGYSVGNYWLSNSSARKNWELLN